ncbi:hypothetical protein B296_00021252 [Ensete ventricosum]|uniref:Uncharacterized protein n=1 Tax=Ensete ventricosum TaxID=4639 RepID=A0A427A9C1_ENSVE|nr:hypothetical protein B296_00021252 [Ensete ventricosum]
MSGVPNAISACCMVRVSVLGRMKPIPLLRSLDYEAFAIGNGIKVGQLNPFSSHSGNNEAPTVDTGVTCGGRRSPTPLSFDPPRMPNPHSRRSLIHGGVRGHVSHTPSCSVRCSTARRSSSGLQ